MSGAPVGGFSDLSGPQIQYPETATVEAPGRVATEDNGSGVADGRAASDPEVAILAPWQAAQQWPDYALLVKDILGIVSPEEFKSIESAILTGRMFIVTDGAYLNVIQVVHGPYNSILRVYKDKWNRTQSPKLVNFLHAFARMHSAQFIHHFTSPRLEIVP